MSGSPSMNRFEGTLEQDGIRAGGALLRPAASRLHAAKGHERLIVGHQARAPVDRRGRAHPEGRAGRGPGQRLFRLRAPSRRPSQQSHRPVRPRASSSRRGSQGGRGHRSPAPVRRGHRPPGRQRLIFRTARGSTARSIRPRRNRDVRRTGTDVNPGQSGTSGPERTSSACHGRPRAPRRVPPPVLNRLLVP